MYMFISMSYENKSFQKVKKSVHIRFSRWRHFFFNCRNLGDGYTQTLWKQNLHSTNFCVSPQQNTRGVIVWERDKQKDSCKNNYFPWKWIGKLQ